MFAEHEMFEKFGGGETSKQGQAAETISCQVHSVGQFRHALRGTQSRKHNICVGYIWCGHGGGGGGRDYWLQGLYVL